MEKTRAVAAANARKKILKIASSLFVKRGFEGVSISEIAKKAEINQSLIYHYFASKEDLWKSVKNDFVDRFSEPDILDPKLGLKTIIHQIVHFRYNFYSKHPEVIRMIGWQRLESKSGKLAGGTNLSPDNWKNVFIELQKQGEVKQEVDIDLMILFISSVITGAFTEDYQKKLHDYEYRQLYLKMIINSFLCLFQKEDD